MEWILEADQTVLFWIRSLHTGWLDGLMIFFTKLGDFGMVWLAAGGLLLCFKRYRRFGVLLLLCLAAGYLFGDLLLKNAVARPRPFAVFPDMELLIPPPHGYSFPSGHALSAFSSAAVLFLADRRFGFPAWGLASMIAFSRPYLFVHYPGDVLAGAVLGALLAYLAFRFGKKLHFFLKLGIPPTNERKKNGEFR